MTYTSGGISSGLGGLLVAFIGAGALVLPVRLSAILAALATFAVLGEEVFAGISGFTTNYPAAGLLCAIMFAIGLAARPLANRIQISEDLARQRGVDLQNLSELNEYIVQHLRESIVVVDADDTVRLSNGSAAQLLGIAEPLRGRPLSSASEQLATYIKLWRLDNAHSSHPELTMVSAGNSIRITAHLAPLGKDGDRSGPTLIFLEDASLLNARVQQSKLASLGRLSASIAHEIRNPVGAMSHAAQLLGETEGLTDGDRRLTEIIRTHSSRVSHIIDNVLQLSRRETSRPKRFTLKPWLADFATEFAGTLELQEGELTVDALADGVDVRMDPSHLRQVLWNLCDNAVKYASETGGILVELRAGMQDDGRPYLEVCDHGNGVDPTSAEKIFEPFYTERSGGTGLGLYMSRELCELNRSTLLYLDRPGGGSIFRVVFADPDRWDPQDGS
jgi:two-component system sensor histidine kinase PilS (NtrC family)